MSERPHYPKSSGMYLPPMVPRHMQRRLPNKPNSGNIDTLLLHQKMADERRKRRRGRYQFNSPRSSTTTIASSGTSVLTSSEISDMLGRLKNNTKQRVYSS